jgi:archaellum biogenesis ATPase FlaH
MDLALFKKILKEKIPLSTLDLPLEILSPEGRKVHEFVKKHLAEFGKYPELSTVEHQVDVKFEGLLDQEPLEFYLKQLRQRAKLYRIGNFIKSSRASLDKDGNPDKIISVMRDVLKDIEFEGKGKPWDICNKPDRQLVWDEYQRLKSLDGKCLGIETPWPFINKATQGLTPGHFTSIISRSETGKSWITLKMAACAHQQGKKVLFVSPEMTSDAVRFRLAAIYNHLPYTMFRGGVLVTEDEQKFRNFVDSDIFNSLIIADTPVIGSSEEVAQMVLDRRPDLVIIDSYFLLSMNRRFSSTNEMREALTIELYTQCKRFKIPYIITTHFTAKVTKEKRGEAEDVAYTKQAIRLADLALGLQRDEDHKANKSMLMRFLKHREGIHADVLINFDLYHMNFDQISVDSPLGEDLTPEAASAAAAAAAEGAGEEPDDIGLYPPTS